MLKQYLLISIFLFTFLCTSCNDKSGSIFSLKENSSFTYINEPPRTETELISVKVISYKKENDYDYAELSSNPYFGRRDEKLFLKIDMKTEKVLTYNEGKESMLLPPSKDLKTGYSWEYNGYDAVITSLNETVKTEKQIFENCLRIDYRLAGTFISEIWIKPGVGIVRFAAFRTNPPVLSPPYYVWNN